MDVVIVILSNRKPCVDKGAGLLFLWEIQARIEFLTVLYRRLQKEAMETSVPAVLVVVTGLS